LQSSNNSVKTLRVLTIITLRIIPVVCKVGILIGLVSGSIAGTLKYRITNDVVDLAYLPKATLNQDNIQIRAQVEQH